MGQQENGETEPASDAVRGWATMNEGIKESGPDTYDQLLVDDRKKKQLLLLARSLSPMKTALRLGLLRHTVCLGSSASASRG